MAVHVAVGEELGSVRAGDLGRLLTVGLHVVQLVLGQVPDEHRGVTTP